MAIAASGAVSLSDFRTEFVGGSSAYLGDLYRGGSHIRAKAGNSSAKLTLLLLYLLAAQSTSLISTRKPKVFSSHTPAERRTNINAVRRRLRR